MYKRQHKANGGLVSARRAGVMVAKGEYVGYVDGDDWVADNWLAEMCIRDSLHTLDVKQLSL